MKEEELLINRLRAYGESPIYPFHMPGHKRLKACNGRQGAVREGMDFPNPFLTDITEVEGFDNLHHAQGILKTSMEWAAKIYGADRTWYLVNGSTCGILAAVCGCTQSGGRILMSRNCHKAAYHAAYLNHLDITYVYPQNIPELGIQGGILPEDVEKLLSEHRDIQAVLLVSPTYDGIVSDIERIGEIVRRAGIPLIVDEAHGAHFHFGKCFPKSALDQGADVVIQSVHKTLPSLTQTSLLHVKAKGPEGSFLADPQKIGRYLSIFQSSSPSYVLMASIENSIFCMERMRREGRIEDYGRRLAALRSRLVSMQHLKLADQDLKGTAGIADLDIAKLVISTRGTRLSGENLSSILREKYGLEMEMCGADYVTAITSVFDSEEGLKRLEKALMEIDREASSLKEGEDMREEETAWNMEVQAVLPLREAMDGPFRELPLAESIGSISAEFVYLYPPGIPILAPGEKIGYNILRVIETYIEKGLPVQGLADESLKTIRVLEESRAHGKDIFFNGKECLGEGHNL